MDSISTSSNEPEKESKRAYWLSHIENWKSSKLGQESYCTQAGINYSTFVYWRGIILSESSQKSKEKFLPVRLLQSKSAPHETPRAIQIKLLSGHSVYLPTTMDINDISKIIHLLG